MSLATQIVARRKRERRELEEKFGKEKVEELSLRQRTKLSRYGTLDPRVIKQRQSKVSRAGKGIRDIRSRSFAERTFRTTGLQTKFLTPTKRSPRQVRTFGTIPVSEGFAQRSEALLGERGRIRKEEAREETIARRKEAFLETEKLRKRERELFESEKAQEVFRKQSPILSRYYSAEESFARSLKKGSGKPFIVTQLEGGRLKPLVIKPSIKETTRKVESVFGERAGGFVKGYLKDIERYPLKHTALFGISAGLPAVSKGFSAIGSKLPRLVKFTRPVGKAIHYGVPTAYGGVVGYRVAREKDPFKQGEILGKAGAELTSVVVGGKFGRAIMSDVKSYRLRRFSARVSPKGTYKWRIEEQLPPKKIRRLVSKDLGLPRMERQLQVIPKKQVITPIPKQQPLKLDMISPRKITIIKQPSTPRFWVTRKDLGVQTKLTDRFIPTRYLPKAIPIKLPKLKEPTGTSKLLYKYITGKYPIFQQSQLIQPPKTNIEAQKLWRFKPRLTIKQPKLTISKVITGVAEPRHYEALGLGFIPRQRGIQLQRMRQRQVQELSPVSVSLAIQKSGSEVVPTSRTGRKTASATEPVTILPPPPIITPPTPIIPRITTPRIPRTPRETPPAFFDVNLLDFKRPKVKQIIGRVPRRSYRYTPNIPALTFNIKSFKLPKFATGFELYRPIPLFSKKKKKKRRRKR